MNRSNTSQLEPIRRVPLLARPAVQRVAVRNGLTLVELLIVIGILTTLVAAAIPLLSPTGNDRRIREASRGVNIYISGAQAKAVALRRPYGVAFKKLSQDTENASDNGVCLEMYYVEQPPAFTGFDETSMVRISLDTDNDNVVLVQFVRRGNGNDPNNYPLPAGLDYDPFPPEFIRKGDVLLVGGTEYVFTKDVQNIAANPLEYYVFDRDANNTITGELAARREYKTGQVFNTTDPDLSTQTHTDGQPRNVALYWTPPPTLQNPPPTRADFGRALPIAAGDGYRLAVERHTNESNGRHSGWLLSSAL